MSEWVIPYQDIEVGDLIGTGRIGKVHKSVINLLYICFYFVNDIAAEVVFRCID